MFEAAEQAFSGALGAGIVVAVAGVGCFKSFLETSVQDLDRVAGVNYRGTYLTMRHGAQWLCDRGPAGGKIITISSVHGTGGAHFNAIYGSTKAAIIGKSQKKERRKKEREKRRKLEKVMEKTEKGKRIA